MCGNFRLPDPEGKNGQPHRFACFSNKNLPPSTKWGSNSHPLSADIASFFFYLPQPCGHRPPTSFEQRQAARQAVQLVCTLYQLNFKNQYSWAQHNSFLGGTSHTCKEWMQVSDSTSRMDTTFSAAAASNLPWRGWNLVCVMPPCS